MAIFTAQQLIAKHNLKPEDIKAISSGQATTTPADSQQSLVSSYLNPFGQKNIDRLKDIPNDVSSFFNNSATTIADQFDKTQETINRVKTGETTPLAGTGEIIGGGLKAGAGVVGEAFTGLAKLFTTQEEENTIKNLMGTATEALAGTRPVQEIKSQYDSLTPQQQRNVQSFIGAAEGIGTMFGAKPVFDVLRKSLGGAMELTGTGIANTVDTLGTGLKNTTDKITQTVTDIPKSTFLKNVDRPEVASSIMDKVARVKPTDYTKFKELSGGKSIGQYLTETGNINAPDQVVVNEAKKFAESIKEVDSTLEQIPGTFKDESIKQALKGLQERSQATSAGKIKPNWNSELNDYIKAYNAGGLDMSQINALKRLYEREVRLSYKKDITAGTALQKATNVDSALRDWQFKTAEENGFKNIADINKQTQMSRFIVDKLGDSLVGKSGLNNVTLTDWLVLSGGDPTSVGGFITKKFFSSKAVQAKIAEIINNQEVRPFVKADYGWENIPVDVSKSSTPPIQ